MIVFLDAKDVSDAILHVSQNGSTFTLWDPKVEMWPPLKNAGCGRLPFSPPCHSCDRCGGGREAFSALHAGFFLPCHTGRVILDVFSSLTFKHQTQYNHDLVEMKSLN